MNTNNAPIQVPDNRQTLIMKKVQMNNMFAKTNIGFSGLQNGIVAA
jgi:hypothetical protein